MRLPNRKERRNYNKQHKTSLSLQDFALAYAIQGAQKGEDISWLRSYLNPEMFPHKDNWDLFPNGTEVRLNFDQIMARPDKYLSEEFKNWVIDNKEEIFTVYRDPEDKSRKGLVTLHYKDESRDTEQSLTWLFDMYSDLLVWSKENNDFVDPQKAEDLSSEVANTKETITMIRQLFIDNIPEDILPALEKAEEKIEKHESGEEYIGNPVEWQNIDNELQVFLKEATEDVVEPEEETSEVSEAESEPTEESTPEETNNEKGGDI